MKLKEGLGRRNHSLACRLICTSVVHSVNEKQNPSLATKKSHAPHQILITKVWLRDNAAQFSLCERYNFVLPKRKGHEKDQKKREWWPCQKKHFVAHQWMSSIPQYYSMDEFDLSTIRHHAELRKSKVVDLVLSE